MKVFQRIVIMAGILTLMSLAVKNAPVRAADNEVTRSTLADLKGIYVQIPPVGPEADILGLTPTRIEEVVRKKLERAGIPMLSKSDYDRLKYSRTYPLARLEVYLSAYKINEPELIIYSIRVEIRQVMFLARKPVVRMLAPTWSKEAFGSTPDLDMVLGKLDGLLEGFIEAFFSVNSK